MRKISIYQIFIITFLSTTINTLGQEIRFISIENNICKPLLYNNNIIFNYRTLSCGYVSAFLKSSYDDFVLFKDQKEFYGSGKTPLSTSKINNWMQESSFRNMSEVKLLLTHVSCRNNRYSQDITLLNFKISAPHGYSLLELPEKPELMRTDLTIKIKEVNPASFLYFIIGIGLSIGGIGYAIENDLFGSGGDNVVINTGLLLGGGIGIISLGADNYYKYKYIPDTEHNYLNCRENDYILSEWKNRCKELDRKNEIIKNTFTIKITLK